ncbi:hypothetical protein F5Y19DRAFT_85859 [Xylariaceae sp. FL1651]|nr:hypothetical protein F5Y19DRAFT_85859 [Xylariaceae sp. FL1651]
MSDRSTAPRHYAILIGIDCYSGKPLKGSVLDIQSIKTHLERTLHFVQVRTLIAPARSDYSSVSATADDATWPTYYNIKSAMEEITGLITVGDFVYIHFSGHGTRERPHERSSNQSGDLALVVLTGNQKEPETYLFGRSLAYTLNGMVRKGASVTLVLDCCFSASVYRHGDPNVRFLPYDGGIGLKVPIEPRQRLDHDSRIYTHEMREASMKANWLLDPDQYAIVAACGPQEEAGEIRFEDGKTHGVLSYFLLRVLQEDNALNSSTRDIYNRIRSMLRKYQPHQNPVLYGRTNQGFFGLANIEVRPAAIYAHKNADATFELQAGEAHGISEGDELALYPIVPDRSTSEVSLLTAKVTLIGPFTSSLQLLNMPLTYESTWWKARTLTRKSLLKFPVRLSSKLPNLDEWFDTLKQRSLAAYTDSEERVFWLAVTLNSRKEFEIRNMAGQQLVNLPLMTQSQTCIGQVGGILQHLAEFQLVKSLRNEAATDDFRKSFDVSIVTNGETFELGSLVEVADGTTAQLVVRNTGSQPLYVSIYNLGPSWQVENIFKGTYAVVLPKDETRYISGVFQKTLCMTVPKQMKERGYNSCDDTVKILVTSQPTGFDVFELPKLGHTLGSGKWSNRGDRKHEDTVNDWVALNFPIRTSAENPC